MKQTFTLIAALLLAGSLATAQRHNPFGPKAKSTQPAEIQAHATTPPAQLKSIQSKTLKSASAFEYPESITNYSWGTSDWAQSSIETYDEQGRILTRTGSTNRDVYTYDTPEWSWIQTSQSRASEAAPWVTQGIQRQYMSQDYNSYQIEYLANDGNGNMVMQNGWKSLNSTTTVGNITTEESLYYQYETIPGSYVLTHGDKNETERNVSGKIIRESYYNFNGTSFVLEDESKYTFDGSGKLTEMQYAYYSTEGGNEINKIELFYNSGTEPDLAFSYTSNDGINYTFQGRYKNLVWLDWVESLVTMDIEPIAYLAQSPIDPMGDKYSDANYTNMEKREQASIGFYDYRWISDAWFLVGQETLETNGEGVTTEIESWIDFDEQSGQLTDGNKQEIVTNSNSITSIHSMYDAEEQVWIPYNKTVETIFANNTDSEETTYFWMDVDDDGLSEWVMERYEKDIYTSNTFEHFDAVYDFDGSISNSYYSYRDLDSYGNTTYSKTQSTFRSFNVEKMEYETITNTEEHKFAYTYSQDRLMQSIETVRYAETGEYANKEKKVYHYKASTAVEPLAVGNIVVYPTVTKQTIHIKTDEAGVATLTNTNGETVKTVNLTAGNNIVQANDLPNGLYIVTIKSKSATTTVKVVKQ